jgi:hypothetical protein
MLYGIVRRHETCKPTKLKREVKMERITMLGAMLVFMLAVAASPAMAQGQDSKEQGAQEQGKQEQNKKGKDDATALRRSLRSMIPRLRMDVGHGSTIWRITWATCFHSRGR